ncbi:MAG: sulfotransferase [Candidatus Baltobacteraceae bacterium]
MESRAVLVLGMHRSGTSAIARGLAALSVYLGDDFLDAQPENPTGYWEDKGIVEINERVLKRLGIAWDDVSPIDRRQLESWRMWPLRREARKYLERAFTPHRLWGFKDPRTIRILPFWRRVFGDARVADSYLVAIRNPRSVEASLYARQRMDAARAQRLWLVHSVPFMREIAGLPFVVVDYDRLMLDPRGELGRIATTLQIPSFDRSASEIGRFSAEFLDAGLRHTRFALEELDGETGLARLTRDAYLRLYDLACDRVAADQFWSGWTGVEREYRALVG